MDINDILCDNTPIDTPFRFRACAPTVETSRASCCGLGDLSGSLLHTGPAQRGSVRLVTYRHRILGRVPMGEQAVFAAAQRFSVHPEQKERMARLLSAWDWGLAGVELQEIAINAQESDQKVWMPLGRHEHHRTGIRLPCAWESSGTQGAFVLLWRLLTALEISGVANNRRVRERSAPAHAGADSWPVC